MIHRLTVPGGWLDAQQLDGQLSRQLAGRPADAAIELHLGQDTRLSIGACVRLLSFLQALEANGTTVSVHGLSTWGLGSYLDRIGFFGLLGPGIAFRRVGPIGQFDDRRGDHPHLVELVAVAVSGARDAALPSKLADRVAACVLPEHREALGATAFTFFAELIDNIRLHSQSTRPGLVALQVYAPTAGVRRMVEVVVSDAGAGVLATLRPALAIDRPALAAMSDEDLLLYAVNKGASRHGSEAGCGITQSTLKVLRRVDPEVSLRVPELRLTLAPGANGYAITDQRRPPALFPLPGTHWVARYALD
ncbi:hypothetical protein [Xanthomonas pisi]|uniref:Uncharacterized protein n=1 Tax=Xanthomonas pisi TaxID=56457 RepID=A0A2S7CYC4_9XANT|nr:hypothetical protein [Xanthomonas pisi]KLD71230.1 hypothetical protein Y887_07415 [Xanthomonas pisi DSM 18956]PPU66454.1 hypothetical protein XpiCFBP4643_19020 [Xanthomonas pisi]